MKKNKQKLENFDEFKHPLTFCMTKKTFDLIWHRIYAKYHHEPYSLDLRDSLWDEIKVEHQD